MVEHYCKVCGLYIETPPWGKDGNCPTHEICPCCNVEFGYEDYTIESAKRFREKWMNQGANWSEQSERPKNWDKEGQFKNIPQEFI